MVAERNSYPSIEQISSYWVDRKNRYGPERIGASFTWMEKFKNIAEAKVQFDAQENSLLNHFEEFLHYIRNLTGQHGLLKLLETGCGAGNLTVRLAEEGNYLIDGIDLCIPLVDYNRARLYKAGFLEAAERIHFGLAQDIKWYPNRLMPSPKFFENESQDLIIWGKLDHRLLGWFYRALDQSLDVMKEGAVLAVYSVAKQQKKKPVSLLYRPKAVYDHREYSQWAWERDEDDYEHYSEIRRNCGKSYLVPIGQRWTQKNCGRTIFFRAWQKRNP